MNTENTTGEMTVTNTNPVAPVKSVKTKKATSKTKTNKAAKIIKAAKKVASVTVPKSTKTPTPKVVGRGRPSGTGNQLVSLERLLTSLPKTALVPVNFRYLRSLNIKPDGVPFVCNNSNIAEMANKYRTAAVVVDLNSKTSTETVETGTN